MESPSTSPEALLSGMGLGGGVRGGLWFFIGMPFLQTPGTKFRVHWEGDHACSLMFAAWPKMESSSVCFLLQYSYLLKNFPQFIMVHTHSQRLWIVKKAEVDVFLELSCFFNDPADVGNLISGSSAFSKTSLNIWKFTVRISLKPGLENFEHYFPSV